MGGGWWWGGGPGPSGAGGNATLAFGCTAAKNLSPNKFFFFFFSSSFLLLLLLLLLFFFFGFCNLFLTRKQTETGRKQTRFVLFFADRSRRPWENSIGEGERKKNNNREKNHHRSRIPCFDFDFPYVGIFNATTTTKHFPKKRGNAMIRSFRWTTTMGVGRPDRDTHTKKKPPKIKQNSVKCR